MITLLSSLVSAQLCCLKVVGEIAPLDHVMFDIL
jgi:hypothetical protein